MEGETEPGGEFWLVTRVGSAPVARGTRLIIWATARPFNGSSSMRTVPTTSASVGVDTSTIRAAAPADTVTLSETVPTSNFTGTVAVWSAINVTFFSRNLRKPGASTVSVYSVGRKEGTV